MTILSGPPSVISFPSTTLTECLSYRDVFDTPAFYASETTSQATPPGDNAKTNDVGNATTKRNPHVYLNHGDFLESEIFQMPRGYMKGHRTLGYCRSTGNGSRNFCCCRGCASTLACARAGEDCGFVQKGKTLLYQSLYIHPRSKKRSFGLTKRDKVQACRRGLAELHEAMAEIL